MKEREILFRGKSETTLEWVEGFYYETYCKTGIQEKGHFKYINVLPETVGQYTGLTDRNGKKIYEGDIVKDDVLFGKVVYATPQDGFDGVAGFMVDDVLDGLQNYNSFWHQVEVIGNIHDEPELLKGGAE